MATVAFKRAGDALLLIGDTKGHLGQSIYLREIEGTRRGRRAAGRSGQPRSATAISCAS